MQVFKLNQSGQTLVEAVIALASIMLTLAAIAIAITTSVSNSTFIKDQSVAGKYASEGMEKMRYLRNVNPVLFESRDGLYCLSDNPVIEAGLVNGACPGVNIENKYIREVNFTETIPGSDCGGGRQVTVDVYWSSGKCSQDDRFCHKSELISCFALTSDSDNTL